MWICCYCCGGVVGYVDFWYYGDLLCGGVGDDLVDFVLCVEVVIVFGFVVVFGIWWCVLGFDVGEFGIVFDLDVLVLVVGEMLM